VERKTLAMKACPYCAEEIQDAAIKCRHCGEWLEQPTKDALGAQGYDVVLTTIGGHRSDAIKAIQVVRDRGQADAEQLAASAPVKLLSSVSAEVAAEARAIVNGMGHGAQVEIRDSATGARAEQGAPGSHPSMPDLYLRPGRADRSGTETRGRRSDRRVRDREDGADSSLPQLRRALVEVPT
jgi:ribosomal protein L7/L12